MLSQAEPKNDMPPIWSPSPELREDINLKKNVLFQALPESPNPQPLDSIAVSLSTNSIRRQDPNIYSDTETRALSSLPSPQSR